MTTTEASIDVDVPVGVAYNQWTQFEEFPNFMAGVEEIRQIDERRTHWRTKIAGVEREFDTEITEQTPDERIVWKTTSGPSQAGVVTFHRLDDAKTRVMLQMDFDPEGFVEQAADKLGVVKGVANFDLGRFKSFIEGRHDATGEWRGTVARPQP